MMHRATALKMHIVPIADGPISSANSVNRAGTTEMWKFRCGDVSFKTIGVKAQSVTERPHALQSEMYQDAKRIEKKLRGIRYQHNRVLELMNWKKGNK